MPFTLFDQLISALESKIQPLKQRRTSASAIKSSSDTDMGANDELQVNQLISLFQGLRSSLDDYFGKVADETQIITGENVVFRAEQIKTSMDVEVIDFSAGDENSKPTLSALSKGTPLAVPDNTKKNFGSTTSFSLSFDKSKASTTFSLASSSTFGGFNFNTTPKSQGGHLLNTNNTILETPPPPTSMLSFDFGGSPLKTQNNVQEQDDEDREHNEDHYDEDEHDDESGASYNDEGEGEDEDEEDYDEEGDEDDYDDDGQEDEEGEEEEEEEEEEEAEAEIIQPGLFSGLTSSAKSISSFSGFGAESAQTVSSNNAATGMGGFSFGNLSSTGGSFSFNSSSSASTPSSLPSFGFGAGPGASGFSHQGASKEKYVRRSERKTGERLGRF